MTDADDGKAPAIAMFLVQSLKRCFAKPTNDRLGNFTFISGFYFQMNRIFFFDRRKKDPLHFPFIILVSLNNS